MCSDHVEPALLSVMGGPGSLEGNALKTLTLADIAAGLDAARFTVVELVQAHLDRIARFNPALNAVIEVNPAALSIAAVLDEERRQSGRRGSVHHRQHLSSQLQP